MTEQFIDGEYRITVTIVGSVMNGSTVVDTWFNADDEAMAVDAIMNESRCAQFTTGHR